MDTMASQITSLTIVYSTVYSGQTQIKENIKALRHWPLWGNSPVTGEFPAQMASNAENFTIWWRHNAKYSNTCLFSVSSGRDAMEMLSTLQALCEENHWWPMGSSHTVMLGFDIFFVVCWIWCLTNSHFTGDLSRHDIYTTIVFNTLRPSQNGRHFADDIFKCIFLSENV